MDRKLIDFVKNNKINILLFLLYIVSPIISLFVFLYLFFFNEKCNKKYLSILIGLSFAYIAFHIIPLETDDLYRHYKILNILRYVPLRDINKYGYPGVILNTFIMYLCSKIGEVRLYPFFMIFVGFFIVGIIFENLEKKFKISNIDKCLIYIFIFFEIVPRYYFSGIRNHMVFIILSFMIIRYYLYNMKNLRFFIIICLILYFVHNGIVLPMFIFGSYELFYKRIKNNSLLKRLCIVSIIFILPIIRVFAYALNLLPLNITLIDKIQLYTSQLINIQNMNQWILFAFLIFFNYVLSYILKKENKINEYNDFFNYFCLYCIAFIPNMMILLRFIYMISILSIPIIFEFFSIKKDRIVKYIKYIMIFVIFIQIIYTYRSLLAYPLIFDKSIIDLLFFI